MNPYRSNRQLPDLNFDVTWQLKTRKLLHGPVLNLGTFRVSHDKCGRLAPIAAIVPLAFFQTEAQEPRIPQKGPSVEVGEKVARVFLEIVELFHEDEPIVTRDKEPVFPIERWCHELAF